MLLKHLVVSLLIQLKSNGMSKYYKMKDTAANLNINLDGYNNIILVLDGNQYQLDKDKIKEMCKKVLPTSFIEVESKYMQDRDLASLHHKYSDKLETLSKLLYLRDIYRNGWKPDWDTNDTKYIIYPVNERLIKTTNNISNRIFSFQSREIRDKFYINFKEMLEEVKDLI